jgi:hypothetical protein
MFAHKTEEILLIVMSEKCNGMLQYNIIQEYFRSIILLLMELDKIFQDFKIVESEFMLFVFALKVDIAKAAGNLEK